MILNQLFIYFMGIYEEGDWCPLPDSNRHGLGPGDFKSHVSTNSTKRATDF